MTEPAQELPWPLAPGERLSPEQVSARLGARFAPTTEQAAVIAAPLEPGVVIAGAGSGKTETMAARVVWLVANGLAEPDKILGLTFTRKAAAELQHRIRTRLSAWYRLVEPVTPPERGEPTVLTYAAYAGRLVEEHGMLVGAEPSARLLSEAARWQVADAVVRRYDGEFTVPPGVPASVTGYVLQLAGQLADHRVGPDQLEAFIGSELAALEALPLSPAAKTKQWPAELGQLVTSLIQRRELIPLVRRFGQAKVAQNAVDFADQMVLAAELSQRQSVIDGERARFDVVLLDEYQDTGVAQIDLLAGLFADGRPVTAVGDPLQSIYGWRGASAGNIGRFPDRFRTSGGDPAPVYSLMTSWRNDRAVLASANRVAQSLRDSDDPELDERPGAGPGTVELHWAQTEPEEARHLAAGLRAEWDRRTDWSEQGKTLAVLVRKRSLIAPIALALSEAGLPVEIVDLGGLLSLPEIVDVVSTLRVLVDHTAGGSLARLLTGARWRIAPADLVSLHRRARELARHTAAVIDRHLQHGAEQPEKADQPQKAADTERLTPSLIEALDDLGDPHRYSDVGFARLSACGAELRRLRRRLDLALPDLIEEIERASGLDIEVASRPGNGDLGRANLDRFADEAARFVSERSVGAGPGQISAFLAFLAAAEDEEYGLKPAATDVRSDRVQVLTIHGSKGLEWDVVAVAGLHTGGFPSAPKGHNWARSRALLPAPLRGDRLDLPSLEFTGCEDRREADRVAKRHHELLGVRYLGEERRLAYVALTRARKAVYCSGAAWGAGKTVRSPSVFLTELQGLTDTGVTVHGWYEAAQDEENPLLNTPIERRWPSDPLGNRRRQLDEVARSVRDAIASAQDAPIRSPRAEQWHRDIDILLTEREQARAAAEIEVNLPAHLSASDLVQIAADESAYARRLRRALPQRPARQARRGTAFHAWLEQRWQAETLLDIDELPGAADEIVSDEGLEELKAAFERSEWADRTPIAVEVAFDMTIAGRVVRGRMDAVFREPDGRMTVVDWKTGAPPRGADATAKAVQLAVYRLAWARLQGLTDDEVGQVGAAFVYVGAGVTVAPVDLWDAESLRALLLPAPTQPERLA